MKASSRQNVIEIIHQHFDRLKTKYGVESLSVFGSASRDELDDQSDVDILVCFQKAASFRNYFALKFFLEEILGRPVDLATESMARKIRPYIEEDLTRVA